MSALKPEYALIEKEMLEAWDANTGSTVACIRTAVIRCQDLADRPVKMLTDEEIRGVIKATHSKTECEFSRAIEAAHIAKQSAPETVPFNFALWQAGGWGAITEGGIKHAGRIFSGVNYPSMVRES